MGNWSLYFVDTIQIAGLVCGLVGTGLAKFGEKGSRSGNVLLLLLLLLVALWGVVGALAPIDGWLFTGVQSFLGVPAFILNGLTLAAAMASSAASPPSSWALNPVAGLLPVYDAKRAFLVAIPSLLVGAAAQNFGSAHHFGFLQTGLLTLGAVVAFVVMYAIAQAITIRLRFVFEDMAQRVGFALVVRGILILFYPAVLYFLANIPVR